MNSILEAALAYRARGWSVVALCPPDHTGLDERHTKTCSRPGKTTWHYWKHYQQRVAREAEMRTWWEQVPTSNVGVVLGRVSRIIAIDVDGGQEGLDLLASLIGEDELSLATYRFTTPGGGVRFLYSIEPNHVVLPRQITKGNGRVELLGEGRYTVMPPSIHANGGVYGA